MPTAHIAAAVESISTARMESIYVVLLGGREAEIGSYGFVDYGNRLLATTCDDDTEYLVSGTDVLRRIPGEDLSHTAESWCLEGQESAHWADVPAGIAAALRLQVAEPMEFTWDDVNGERLRRYTFLIRPKRSHADAMIARMYEHLNYHRVAQLFLDFWLTDDDELYATRELSIMARWAQNAGTTVRATVISWDFGVATELSVPEQARIIRSANASKHFYHLVYPEFFRAQG